MTIEQPAEVLHALRKSLNAPTILDSLGWVYLRPGQFDKSMREFDLALNKEPKLAGSSYGRGLDELRLGKSAAGHADLDAARGLRPDIADRMRGYGISP